MAMTPGEETSFTYDQRYGVRAVSVEGKHADPTQLKVENVSEGDDLWLHLTEMRRATLTMSTHPITLVVHSETRGDVKIAIVPAPESNAPDAVEK